MGSWKALLAVAVAGLVAVVAVVKVKPVRAWARDIWYSIYTAPPPEPASPTNDPSIAPSVFLLPHARSGTWPNVHWTAGGEPWLLAARSTPAIKRRVGDVADRLAAVGMALRYRCKEAEPDLRISARIDRADGTVVGWNEKSLKEGEHVPGEWLWFNMEWLIRELPVSPDDSVSIFFRDPGRAGVELDRVDVVFGSAAPLAPRNPTDA